MRSTSFPRSAPARLLLIGAAALALLLLLLDALPIPLALDVAEGSARLHLESDRRGIVFPGGCITVRWQAEGVRAIYLDGAGVAGAGERVMCLERGEMPRLRVVLPDGGSRTYRLPVGVLIFRAEFWLSVGAAALALILAAWRGEIPRLQARWRMLAAGLLLVGAATALGLALLMAARPSIVDTASGDAQVTFAADGGWLLNRCLDVRWEVEGVRAVYLDGEGVPGTGGQTLCGRPLPTLRVELPDGSTHAYTPNAELAWLLAAAVGMVLLAGRMWFPALPAGWSRPAKLAFVAAILVLPAVLTYLLVSAYLGKDPTDFIPFMADELYYWRQILTFSAAGFGGGYYTYAEAPAPAVFSHFGAWGPVFPLLYGLPARLTGWGLASGTAYNVAVIAGALALFVILTRPDGARLLALLLAVLTAWPALLYLPTAMQESLNQAIGIALAGGFAVWLRRDNPPRWVGLLLGVSIFLAALLRTTWAFLFVPFFLIGLKEWTPRAVVLALAKAGALIAACFAVYGYWSAPYPLNFLATLARLAASAPGEALAEFGRNLSFNVRTLLAPEMSTPLEALLHWQMLFLLAGCGVGGILLVGRRSGGFKPPLQEARLRVGPELLFHAANLGLPLIVLLLLYTFGDWRDYRTLAPHLLASLCLLIARRRLAAAYLPILASLLLLPAFLGTFYEGRMPNYVIDRQRLIDFEDATREALIFQDGADGWCNTALVTSAVGFRPELAALPPGMGFSMVFPSDIETFSLPPRSRYLLLDEATYAAWQDGLHVERLAELPFGTLYLNRDAACESD